jgi:hypothetical protein
MHRNSRGGTVRLDKRGRRIGHNWWREYNYDLWFLANTMWLQQRETECSGWLTEEREYQMLHPRPTLKQFLLCNARMLTEPEAEAAQDAAA